MSNIILEPHQIPAATAPAVTDTDILVMDGTTENFTQDVIEASAKIPIVVYFGSAESPGSESMSALLQKLVERAGGLVKMVRMDVYENQALAQQLQVKSVPTVFAFVEGRPIDAFAGQQGEAQLQSFLDKLLGDAKPPLEIAMDQGQAFLSEGLGVEAEEAFSNVLAQDETYFPALGGLIRAIALQGEFERAQQMIDHMDDKTRTSLDVTQAISALELAMESAHANPDETQALLDLVKDEPKNIQARFNLAQAYYAAGKTPDAIDLLLDIVAQDRAWDDQAGRKQLIKIFDALGVQDPITIEARKRLSAVLFS